LRYCGEHGILSLEDFILNFQLMSHRKGQRQNRQGKHWSPAEVQRMKKLAKGNTPTPLIADALGRTPEAIYTKASQKSVSLKPTNQSPYNRRKKK